MWEQNENSPLCIRAPCLQGTGIKTPECVCVIRSTAWSSSGCVSPLCITALCSLSKTFLGATWVSVPLCCSGGVGVCIIPPRDLELAALLGCQGNFTPVSGTFILHRWNCEVTCRHTLPLKPSSTVTLQIENGSVCLCFPSFLCEHESQP